MGEREPNGRSHLFLVRLWLDQADSVSVTESLSHGKVQHLITGKASPFSDWSSLIDLLASMASTPLSTPSLPSIVTSPRPSDSTSDSERSEGDQTEHEPPER